MFGMLLPHHQRPGLCLAKAEVALVFEVGQLPHCSNQPPNLWLPHAPTGSA